ncbi:MAG: SDR family oxidoreductase [Acidimicrobiaceae bacterium]|nr:SDR family oxidoreductase [Acidimicrobiaceae bacterium]
MGILNGRVIIVTGGAKGIGLAYCRGLAAEGAAVVVADLTDGSDVVAELSASGAEATSVQVDVSDAGQTEAMAAAAVDAYGRIDGLVNNAAFYMAATRAPMWELPPDEWDLCFAVNVRGSWLCARAVLPAMRDGGGGRIVNIASMTVNDGTPNFLHYVSSKSAVWGLTRAMARELGGFGINVNTITPDYIPHDEAYSSVQPEVDVFIQARRAFKRTQTPEDMVGTLVYLMSPLSDFVTGQNIWVNGGSGFH